MHYDPYRGFSSAPGNYGMNANFGRAGPGGKGAGGYGTGAGAPGGPGGLYNQGYGMGGPYGAGWGNTPMMTPVNPPNCYERKLMRRDHYKAVAKDFFVGLFTFRWLRKLFSDGRTSEPTAPVPRHGETVTTTRAATTSAAKSAVAVQKPDVRSRKTTTSISDALPPWEREAVRDPNDQRGYWERLWGEQK